MKRSKTLMCIIVILLQLFFSVSAGHSYTFTDNFDGDINSYYWTINTSGGSAVTPNSGRVLMTQGTSGDANLVFNFASSITGDFEVKIDYTLDNWPQGPYGGYNDERSGIRTNFGAVERISDIGLFGGNSGEMYLTDFSSSIVSQKTDHIIGTLRLVRTSGTLTGFYWNGSDWTPLGKRYDASGALSLLQLSIWPESITPGVKVAFDNFSLEYSGTEIPTQGVPEPATMLLLGFGLAGLAGMRRSRN